MNIKEMVKKNKLIFSAYKLFKTYEIDLKYVKRIKKQKVTLKEKKEVINVGFLCQYIPAWNKFQPVFEVLEKDDRFKVFLFCVPGDINDNKLNDASKGNDTFDYYIKHGYDAINSLNEDGTWVDLKKYDLDYVVFTRPYNCYMPVEYTSDEVSKYSRVMSLLYAMNLTVDTFELVLNQDFFKDSYMFFAETEISRKKFIRQYPISVRKGLKKCFFCGMPGFEQIIADEGKKSTSWDFSNNKFRILWTPRWTTDPKFGGSNFFVYYKVLLEYAKQNPDVDLLIRPHPLLFDNFKKTGEMTEAEINAYKQQIENLPNVSLDYEAEYGATLWGADVMISDVSGIMPEFFFTGKPLIYCASNMYLTLAEHTEKMLEGCYVANNEKETFEFLDELKKGNDSKFDVRKDILTNLFGLNNGKPSEKIADKMAECIFRQ